MKSALANIQKDFRRMLAPMLIVSFIISCSVLTRELFLDIFQGFNFSFFKEILRNNLVMGSHLFLGRAVFVILEGYLPWQKHFPWMVWMQLLVSFLVAVACTAFYVYFLQGVIDDNEPSSDRHFLMFLFFWISSLLLNFILELSKVLQQWKKSLIETEKLNKERIAAELAALKNQINPHFLFNSLNTLSSLVYKDPEQADEFIQQLSKVYRYLLENKEKDLIPLSEELNFIESYIYLLKIRFKEGFEVSIQLQPEHLQTLIAPNSLQILLENAVKHNIIAKKTPLAIRIYEQGNFLVVENNLQERRNKEYSSKTGLHNINVRYEYLAQKQIVIEQNAQYFTVKIPFIHPTQLNTKP